MTLGARIRARSESGAEASLLKLLPAGMLLLDGDGRVLSSSLEMDRMMGRCVGDLSEPVQESEDFPRAQVMEALRGALKEWASGTRVVTLDRQHRHYVLVRTAVTEGASEPKRMIVVVTDFTEIIQQGHVGEDFVSQVRHDLRGPLTSMRGAVDLLRTQRLGRLDERQTRLLDLMDKASQQMLGIVSGTSANGSAQRPASEGSGTCPAES